MSEKKSIVYEWGRPSSVDNFKEGNQLLFQGFKNPEYIHLINLSGKKEGSAMVTLSMRDSKILEHNYFPTVEENKFTKLNPNQTSFFHGTKIGEEQKDYFRRLQRLKELQRGFI